MPGQFGEPNTHPSDPRGGFKHKPGFDLVRGADGNLVADEVTNDDAFANPANPYDPYQTD